MVLFMKGSGRTTSITAEASCTTPVEIYTKENSLMIWLKALVFISTQMEANMSVTGIKTNNTDLERKNGMTQVCTKGSTRTLAKRAKVNTSGQMATDISVSGARICSMELVSSSGMMKDSTSETGKTT